MTQEAKVSVAMWRVNQAARVALVAMPAHRDQVPRVLRIEGTLVPAIEAFVPASDALFAYDSKRKALLALHDAHLEELYRCTLYWLTYVRMDVPNYEASEMPMRGDSTKVVIDRAQRVLTLIRLDPEDHVRRDYAERLVAELSPLYERSVADRVERDVSELELVRLQTQARELMAPVHRDIATLRMLLRNALGKSHPHVRGLNTDPPRKPKKTASAPPDQPAVFLNGSGAPTDAAHH